MKKFLEILDSDFGWRVIFAVILVGVAILMMWLLTRLNKHFFRRLRKKQERGSIHLKFFERFINVVIVIAIIILAISAFTGANTLWKTVLGGTAVVSAVLAFAAQDVIKDILAGLMISVNKPFEIGDRVIMDDGRAGIIEDITMRHVVIRVIDTVREVIPNSKINAMVLENYSYHTTTRSIHFRFPVGYKSDVDFAKRVVEEAVEASPLTVPGKPSPDGAQYGRAYFLEFTDSALILGVTVYYDPSHPTEVVKDEVNTAVRRALLDHGIEIPYNYVNVVVNDESKEEK